MPWRHFYGMTGIYAGNNLDFPTEHFKGSNDKHVDQDEHDEQEQSHAAGSCSKDNFGLSTDSGIIYLEQEQVRAGKQQHIQEYDPSHQMPKAGLSGHDGIPQQCRARAVSAPVRRPESP
jgi:hypothetical protein